MSSFFNSRIRRLPPQQHNYFSVSSSTLPPGTLLVQEQRTQESVEGNHTPHYYATASSLSYNLHRVILLKNAPILDHGWALVSSSQSGESTLPLNLYLATLTRHHSPLVPTLESHVDIYCLNTLLQDSALDQQSPAYLTISSVRVPSFSTSLCIDSNFLAISTSSGLLVYNIDDFTNPKLDGTINPVVTLLPYHTVHACTLSYPYIAAASNDRVGVWDLSTLLSQEIPRASPYIPPCSWSTSVRECDSRFTSILFVGENHEYLAMSCWDGSAYIYHGSVLGCDWRQVFHLPSPETLVESITYPTFMGCLCKSTSLDERLDQNCLILSSPGSLILRVLDLNMWKETSYLGLKATTGNFVLGLVVMNDIVVWMDEKMQLHEEKFAESH